MERALGKSLPLQWGTSGKSYMAPSVLSWAAEQPVASGRAGQGEQLEKELCLYFCNRSFGPEELGALEEMNSELRMSTLKKLVMKSQIQSTPNSRVSPLPPLASVVRRREGYSRAACGKDTLYSTAM